jgi:hypothetical protein
MGRIGLPYENIVDEDTHTVLASLDSTYPLARPILSATSC